MRVVKIVEGEGDWEGHGMTKGHDLFRKLAGKAKRSLGTLGPLERDSFEVEEKVEIATDTVPQGSSKGCHGTVTYEKG